MKRIDLTGQRFGTLVVIERSHASHWRCVCDCGSEVIAPGNNIKRCGTCRKCSYLTIARKVTTHGLSESREFGIWRSMLSRCSNPNYREFHHYGGRGIRVCERWRAFEYFYADMGPRPSSKHSIDRIDTNGNYEPSNCRWATWKEQQRNRRNNRILEIDGVKKCVAEWAEVVGLDASRINDRLAKGWCPHQAILPMNRQNRLATRRP